MTTEKPGQLDGATPMGMRLQRLRGAPRQAGGVTMTPIARRLALRWPGGGRASTWPVAIEIQTERGTERLRVIPLRRIALATLTGFTLAALAGVIAQWWLDKRMVTQDGSGGMRGVKRDDNDK